MNLNGFGFREESAAIQAAGAALYYTVENLKYNAGHIRKIALKRSDIYLGIDPNSRRNLELVEPLSGSAKNSTLLHVLDRTKTPMGGRLLKNWILNPLRDVTSIVERQDVVGLFKDDPLTLAELRETISGIRDLERITAKLNVNSANPRDLAALATGLQMIPGVEAILSAYDLPLLIRINDDLVAMDDLAAQIENTLVDDPPAAVSDGGVIRAGCSPELDELRSASADGRNWIAALQAKEQQAFFISDMVPKIIFRVKGKLFHNKSARRHTEKTLAKRPGMRYSCSPLSFDLQFYETRPLPRNLRHRHGRSGLCHGPQRVHRNRHRCQRLPSHVHLPGE